MKLLTYLLIFLLCIGDAFASQNTLSSPTTGTVSGLQLTTNYNNALDSLNTCNSGGSAPTNQLTGSPSLGNCWINTTSNYNAVNFYDGASWVTVGYIDATNHVFTPVTASGQPATVASVAGTTNLCGASGATPNASLINISGTNAITSFGTQCPVGALKTLIFLSTASMTYNATSMILPTAASITAVALDTAVVQYLGSGNWQVLVYQRSTGAALSSVGLSVGSNALASSSVGMNAPLNLQIGTTNPSNTIVASILGMNGSVPSSTNPVLMGFRSSATPAGGLNVAGSIQASLSYTLASTFSLGCTTGVPCRVWLTIFCTGETGTNPTTCSGFSLGASASTNSTAAGGCQPLPEQSLVTTASATGTTLGTIYTGSTLSAKAFRIVGYMEATWTSGTGWGAPTVVVPFTTGMKKPCETVQGPFSTTDNTNTACSTTTNTITAITTSITPISSINMIETEAKVSFSVGNTSSTQPTATVRIYRYPTGSPGTSNQVGNSGVMTVVNGGLAVGLNQFEIMYPLDGVDFPASGGTATSYTVYEQSSGGTGCNVNGSSSTSRIKVREIMGALDVPANDNSEPLRKVG